MWSLSKSAATLGAGALLLGGGTAYALASSTGATITVCVKHDGGAFYKAKKCAKHDSRLSWNKQGSAGVTGATGATGAIGLRGPKGDTGAQGPGATTFAMTLPSGTAFTSIATLPNGMLLDAGCSGGKVDVGVERSASQVGLQVSGTWSNDGATPTEATYDSPSGFGLNTGPGGTVHTDIDWIVGVPGGKYTRIDIHGTQGSPCSFWGMVTPSS
jgi:hypothetical protein